MILRDAELRVLGDLPVVTSSACWVCVLVLTCTTTHTSTHEKPMCLWTLELSEDLVTPFIDNHLDDLGFLESLWAS